MVLKVCADKDAQWEVKADKDWIVIKKPKGKGCKKVKVVSKKNKTGKKDEETVWVECGEEVEKMTVKRYAQ